MTNFNELISFSFLQGFRCHCEHIRAVCTDWSECAQCRLREVILCL